MLHKLCYQDPGKLEFKAEVLKIQKDKGGFGVLLDVTWFYPQGGGQPADKGWLNNLPVLDVREEGGKIYHYLSRELKRGPVKARIDPESREEYKQQHTGQHIISAALWKIGGYKTVSVHMGADYTTVEIETPDITENELRQTEELAHKIICSNRDINIIITNPLEVNKYSLRKPCEVSGDIRLVQIRDFDSVACCGLHVKNTREIGLVKAIGIERIRGNTRISWKIGKRAYMDYDKKTITFEYLRNCLETGEDKFVEKGLENIKQTLTEKDVTCWKTGWQKTWPRVC